MLFYYLEGEQDNRWSVKKDGGLFDQFTGATITPRAVVRAIKNTVLYLQNIPDQLATLPSCGDNE